MRALASLAAWSTLALPDRILVIMSLSGFWPASTAAQLGSFGVIWPLADDFAMAPSSGSLPSTVWPRLADAGMAPFSLARRVWYFSESISLTPTWARSFWRLQGGQERSEAGRDSGA